jgi:hypothetical protein
MLDFTMVLEFGAQDVKVEENMECINLHKIYKARSGAPFKQEEAQEIGEALDSIREKCDGEFKIDIALKEAKKINNPLHEHLEWDDTKCGVEYRIQQLRNITNHIVDEIIVDGEPTEQRSFLSVTNDEGDMVYVSRETAIEVVDYKKQLLDRMISTLENLTTTMKIFRQHDYK